MIAWQLIALNWLIDLGIDMLVGCLLVWVNRLTDGFDALQNLDLLDGRIGSLIDSLIWIKEVSE